jgi:hypothetical protein
MSSITSSKKEETANTSSTSTTKPLEWQANALEGAFGKAKTALNQAQKAPTPDSFVAQFGPEQLAVFNKMMGYANGDTGGALSSAGSNSAVGGFNGLNDFTPKGGTDYNIAAATAYANNPAIDGMVTSAMRDSTRQVNEQTLPGIGRDAASTGNVNSNRRAISEGIVQRGLADKTADVSSQLRGAAYQDGLSLAQKESQATNDSTLQALLARISGGTNATSSGMDVTKDQFNLAGLGIAGQQDAKQAVSNEQQAQYQFGVDSPFAALNNYYNIIGNKNWGGTTNATGTANTTTTATPSMLDSIGKAISMGGTVFGSGGLNWLPKAA